MAFTIVEKIILPRVFIGCYRINYPYPGVGILTYFPFDRCDLKMSPFETELPYLLGSTNPCPSTVYMEPFSTSVFKVGIELNLSSVNSNSASISSPTILISMEIIFNIVSFIDAKIMKVYNTNQSNVAFLIKVEMMTSNRF